MRVIPILLLTVGVTLGGCDGNPPTGEPPTEEPPTGEPPTGEPPTGEPPAHGSLVVSTSTSGDDPDPDGYR
jgi:hypothetical protein